MLVLNVRNLNFIPPKRILIPVTSRRFPNMEPARLARTSECIPELIANPHMRISGTFPMVAFKNPPILGPV
jgi:hypothetical protein